MGSEKTHLGFVKYGYWAVPQKVLSLVWYTNLLIPMSVIFTMVSRGRREPGNSIKDPGMARTGIGFLVLLLYENT